MGYEFTCVGRTILLFGLFGRICTPGDKALMQPDHLVRHFRETNGVRPVMLDYAQRTDPDVLPPCGIMLGPNSAMLSFLPPVPDSSASHASARALPAGPQGSTRSLHSFRGALSRPLPRSTATLTPPAHTDLPRYLFGPQPHTYPARTAGPARARVMAADLAPILTNHVVVGYLICSLPPSTSPSPSPSPPPPTRRRPHPHRGHPTA